MKGRFPLLARMGAAAYPAARNLLFRCTPETAHELTVKGLTMAQTMGLARVSSLPGKPVSCMGLTFPNALGLAAGLDKDASVIDAFGAMGFGSLEIGTLTPRPQPGNDKPRLFRLIPEEAIINRMGFNNHGVQAALPRLEKRRYPGILGVNIGKNKTTPNAEALDDYLACLRAVHQTADYVAVNFSSPNTPGLRELQDAKALRALLTPLLTERDKLAESVGKRTPIAVKIAPDLEDGQLESMAEVFNTLHVDAVIATNTTLDRTGVAHDPRAGEAGGLSGDPLRTRSNALIRSLHSLLDDKIPIIGVGGILTPEHAEEKIHAGATLVQIYTGLIFRGPALVRDCINRLAK